MGRQTMPKKEADIFIKYQQFIAEKLPKNR